MEVALYIVSIIFAVFGVGVWLAAAKSKSVSHILGCLCYVGGAVGSIVLQSWLPLLIGFGLTFIVRKLFGDLHSTSSITSRSSEYKQISEVIGNSYTSKVFNSEEIEKRRVAEEHLFTLIETDSELRQIIEPKGIDVTRLKKIYNTLIFSGAGQWAGTEWVPSVGITTPYTLTYLLDELAGEDLNSDVPSEKIQTIAWHVLNYFKRGEPLP